MSEHTETESISLPSSVQVPRLLGEFKGALNGPNHIFIAGIHGNEPSGVLAMQRILAQLEEIRPNFHGSLLSVSGNRQALERGERYVDIDLNRIWHRDANPAQPLAEESEKTALLEVIVPYMSSDKPTFFFDLHSTSSESIPFIVLCDSPGNREITEGMPVPIILGLEKYMEGTLFNYLTKEGFTSVIFEGGQHLAPSSVDFHESFVWLMLERTGALNNENIPNYNTHRERLTEVSGANILKFESVFRHALIDRDGFKMEPGFVNFEAIDEGQLLAYNSFGPIYAKNRGRIFMPLYQKQGDDGFFIIRETTD